MTLDRRTTRVVPIDLAAWFSEHELVSLALEAVAEGSWPDARKRTTCLSATPEAVLRTLIIYCYARGILLSDRIAALCGHDSTCRYICAGAFPLSHEIRNFRRANISWLQSTLSILLKAAMLKNLDRLAISSANISEWAREQAALRLRQAVQADSMALDE